MAVREAAAPPAGGLLRRASAGLFRHPRAKLVLLLLPPLAWMVVIYFGSLSVMFLSSLWRLDSFTGLIVHDYSLTNFHTLTGDPVYRAITFRTLGIAASVTLTDITLALPLAYYAARMASPKVKTALLLAVVLPLWSSYLVRVFAWQVILSDQGFLNWVVHSLLHVGSLQIGNSNWAVWLAFCYLWLPFVALPIYAALERIPGSYLEASSDLGGKGWMTFRRVVWPLALPGIVAGSIFSFSLTLGDYIVPTVVGNTQFIGNVVYQNVGIANNLPFAAAYALVPVVIMAVYLTIARALGAFEAL